MDDTFDTVAVTQVHIPAWSTVGFGFGKLESGNYAGEDAVVVGDHSSMRNIGEVIAGGGEPVLARGDVIATGEAAREMRDQWT